MSQKKGKEKQFPDLEEDEKNRSFLLGELFLTRSGRISCTFILHLF